MDESSLQGGPGQDLVRRVGSVAPVTRCPRVPPLGAPLRLADLLQRMDAASEATATLDEAEAIADSEAGDDGLKDRVRKARKSPQ